MSDLWERAQQILPGGVNSPVRSFRGVGGTPFFGSRAQGPYLWDATGRQLIDYVMSYGPLLLGHAHPAVVEATQKQAQLGLSYGVPTGLEVEMAETLVEAVPPMEMVRMVNSGTEATMSALRVARGVTGRRRIIKFTGCYHGHHDSLLIRAGSGAATLGIPDSLGVPSQLAELTLTADYNSKEQVQSLFEQFGSEIAAVIMEPIAGNMGTVLPDPGFLSFIRNITREYGALWILDEVMTGFRVQWGGATRWWELDPDLICLAKVIGAGMPVGAYGGRRQYMELVAPLGPVYQAGTLSGNPVAMAAGLAQLSQIHAPHQYDMLHERVRYLAAGMEERARKRGVAATVVIAGGMFTLFFSHHAPRNFREVQATDIERYRRYFHGMLEEGIFMPPSPYETVFPSLAHDERVIEETLQAADRVFQGL